MKSAASLAAYNARAADGSEFASHAAADAADAEGSLADIASDAVDAVGNATIYTITRDGETSVASFDAISADLELLESFATSATAAQALVHQPLWPKGPPKSWTSRWQADRNKLLRSDPSFEVWVDWYERRIRGEAAAFDVPGDMGRKEDRWLLRQIANATDEDFWAHGAKYVNEQLASWLEEARERAAKNLPLDDSTETDPTEPAVPPPQSRTALRFARSEDNKIVLAAPTNVDDLRKDQDARDRHETVLEDAKALLAACAGRNSAERLTSMLTAYIEAAGESIETMRPSKFVQKGERLRQELARYEGPDTDLPPLPDGILNDLGSVARAHNMVVGLDPFLVELDTAQIGPDDIVGDVTKPEMTSFVAEASEAELLEEEASETIKEAVELTPDSADAADRRFRWSAGSCKNLVIEAFAIVLNKPVTTTAVVAGGYAVGPGLLVGNALACALFLYSHRTWIEMKLGRNAPTWKHLFVDLCDRLDAMKKPSPN